ncbi:MAG: hypothetical protein EBX52_01540 [Proteobacteria bacterium]|nr:hypothetical protein [Pseudomonadota bacterium]
MEYPSFAFQQSILFIDDQTRFESLIRGGLLNFPAQYEFCPSRVATALERLEQETPDLIVATLDFSEGSILELVQKTEGFIENVPAIYLSEPHLADVEAEMALRGRFMVMEREADPLSLIRKMSQLIAENVNREKPRFRPGKSKKRGEITPEEEALLSHHWADAILKKNG